MSDFDRAEQAFRDALNTHAAEAPDEAPRVRARRRPWWLIGTAAAVAAAATIVVPSLLAGDKEPDRTPVIRDGGDWQWVGLRDVEVQAPAGWTYDYEAVRPDCINVDNPHDPWAKDVPEMPYISVGSPNRGIPTIGCLREPQAGDPDPAFGALPFALWQPYVKLEGARPDLDYAEHQDGEWRYRDWHLTRATIGAVQLTVLAPPSRPELGETVVESARRVEVTHLGCDPESPAQNERFAVPDGLPVPSAGDVAAVAVCEYSRMRDLPTLVGLEGSTRITGEAARELVLAIHSAAAGGGPDDPEHCVDDMYGDRAIALRFFGDAGDTTTPIGEAFVYFDWCFGNGIVDARGKRALTRGNCAPLFGRAPIGFWGGQAAVVAACGPLG